MQTRPLGNTGARVTGIGLGCAPMMGLPLRDGVRLVERALELGLTYIDTARSYGETEVMVGQALRGHPRERVFLSTKTGASTREEAWRSLLQSLERLQVDYVDNLHLHNVTRPEDLDRRTGPGGALEALIEARDQGLVRHLGATAHTSRALLDALERFPFEVILVPLNIVEREPLRQLIPLCIQRGVGVTVMKPVATGLLPGGLALKWLLNQPIAAAVPGAVTLEELELDAAVCALDDVALSPNEETQVERLRQELEHVRCRICGECLPCPQGLNIHYELGSDTMYDTYRTLGREAFAAKAWSASAIAADLKEKQELVATIQGCDACRACEARCPYGLHPVEMLQALLPALHDMIGIYTERLHA
ncbi:MAG: aldo/keto reductase [Anaerolineae bacterium]|nr:aldo/keto reductase [Anaerolineae bacterium]